MTGLAITRHARIRMSQRAVRESDVDFLLSHGTDMGADRIILTKREAANAIQGLKKRSPDIERLTGKVLVVAEGRIVTVYHEASRTRRSRSGKR